MEVAARPAVAADLPRMAELLASGIEELRPTRGGALFARREARPDTTIAGAASALSGDRGCVRLGTIDDVVVGVATARYEVLHDGGRLAVVEEIYVEPGAREVGVGEALLDALLEWAVEHGCEGIDAMVLPGNREAKNFFETFGMTARAIIVHRDLEAPT